jgi:hypothetical protein
MPLRITHLAANVSVTNYAKRFSPAAKLPFASFIHTSFMRPPCFIEYAGLA